MPYSSIDEDVSLKYSVKDPEHFERIPSLTESLSVLVDHQIESSYPGDGSDKVENCVKKIRNRHPFLHVMVTVAFFEMIVPPYFLSIEQDDSDDLTQNDDRNRPKLEFEVQRVLHHPVEAN